jgi:hypothetical protein
MTYRPGTFCILGTRKFVSAFKHHAIMTWGGVYTSHTFLVSTIRNRWSASRPGCVTLGKITSVHNGYEAGWASQWVPTFWRRDKFLFLLRIAPRLLDFQVSSLVTTPTELSCYSWRICQLCTSHFSHICAKQQNKKFWEELIVYFPFTIIWVSGMTSKKKTLVSMRNKVNKTIQIVWLHCWCYWWKWFMKYTVEITS